MARQGGLLGGGLEGGSGAAPIGFNGEAGPDEEPNVSPEEQQQYDRFVENGMQLIYDENGKVSDEVVKRLSTGNKPIDALAQTAVWLVMLLEQDAARNKATVEDDVLMHAGKELFEQLVEVAEALGIHTYKEAELQGAWYTALDMYREANSDEGGRFDPEIAAAEFTQLNEADKEGRADEVLPGFEEQTEKAIFLAKNDQNPVDEEVEADG